MRNDKIISLEKPEENADLLTGLLKTGARELITQAVQAELASFLSQHQEKTDEQGRPLVVRNGYLPKREILTGIGPIQIKVSKTRDRSGQKIHFRSELLPQHIKPKQSVETVLLWLYLKGISMDDFLEGAGILAGQGSEGLSAGTISRLKQSWIRNTMTGERAIYPKSVTLISGQTAFFSRSAVTMPGIAFW